MALYELAWWPFPEAYSGAGSELSGCSHLLLLLLLAVLVRRGEEASANYPPTDAHGETRGEAGVTEADITHSRCAEAVRDARGGLARGNLMKKCTVTHR